jgi:hypothetical protein
MSILALDAGIRQNGAIVALPGADRTKISMQNVIAWHRDSERPLFCKKKPATERRRGEKLYPGKHRAVTGK